MKKNKIRLSILFLLFLFSVAIFSWSLFDVSKKDEPEWPKYPHLSEAVSKFGLLRQKMSQGVFRDGVRVGIGEPDYFKSYYRQEHGYYLKYIERLVELQAASRGEELNNIKYLAGLSGLRLFLIDGFLGQGGDGFDLKMKGREIDFKGMLNTNDGGFDRSILLFKMFCGERTGIKRFDFKFGKSMGAEKAPE